MIKTVLTIDGMACGMCESHVNEAIRRTFPVKSVKSSHQKKRSEILSEQPLDEAALRAAIAETGYTLLDITSEESVKKKGFFRR